MLGVGTGVTSAGDFPRSGQLRRPVARGAGVRLLRKLLDGPFGAGCTTWLPCRSVDQIDQSVSRSDAQIRSGHGTFLIERLETFVPL
jgi:hypothetical protein